jgi:taurine dioxygenase
LSREEFDVVRKAWLTHIVLLFREQQLSDADLVQFSRRFGVLDVAPMSDIGISSVPNFPEIFVLSNVVEKGRPIGTHGAREVHWHTIMSYTRHPPMANVLYPIEVTHRGGESGFLNMYLALETLSTDLRTRIEGRTAKHDATIDSAGRLRSGAQEIEDPAQGPGAHHPLIVSHPDTHREALYLGRRKNAHIDDLPRAESEALLDALWKHATEERFAWHHHWRLGDLILWDNRVTLYRRTTFDPNERRIMHRTQIRSSLFGY